MLGWITYTLSPGAMGHTPSTANIRLRFSAGPWNPESDIEPDFHGVMTLSYGGTLNGIGQTAAGKAFVAITESAHGGEMTGQLGFVAITKDGRELDEEGSIVGGPSPGPYRTQVFEFAAPLATIKAFRSPRDRSGPWSSATSPSSPGRRPTCSLFFRVCQRQAKVPG